MAKKKTTTPKIKKQRQTKYTKLALVWALASRFSAATS
jgi:hypothetical protein